MHAWKHWLIGSGFFGFGTFKLLTGGSFWLVGLCAVASAYIFYRALTDQTGAALDDLGLAIGFVRNPVGAVVDQAVEMLSGDDGREDAKRGPAQALVAKYAAQEAAKLEALTAAAKGSVATAAEPQPPQSSVERPVFGRRIN